MLTSPTKFGNERRQRPDAFATDALPRSAVKLVAEYTVNTCTHHRFQNFAVFFAPLDLMMEQEESTRDAVVLSNCQEGPLASWSFRNG